MTTVPDLAALRQLYPQPMERAVRKQIASLDVHCRRFIALSPFLVLSTSDAAHNLDASPRGGAPGFVRVADDHTLLLPDASGNNRLDSLENILATGQVGLLFMIPGVDETLRVNGHAVLSVDAADIAACPDGQRAARLVLRITVQAAYLHCAKAYMRSRLWDPATHVARSELPTIGQMIADQLGLPAPAETRDEMVRRYAADL